VTQFSELGLAEPLLRALNSAGYEKPSPIQAQAIPTLLEGRDLLGIAQTGTGKTAAFALPLLTRLLADRKRPAPGTVRMLVLAPTRELAAQIADSFREYGQFMRPALQVGVVVGGVSARPQADMLTRGVEVLVATPGRLLDHLSTRRTLLSTVEAVVLDEADHMLDLGFIIPIRRIVAMLPKARQTLLFSATMPREIAGLASDLLRDPQQVSVAPVATTAERVTQSVILVDTAAKRDILTELMQDETVHRAIVFTRTKHGADRVARHLEAAGVGAQAIHGNKSQNQRVRALESFRNGTTRVLVATDIAARGIDVDGITHVVNFELPDVPESYVHRIGRTARAGASGQAISLCDNEERSLLRQIEKLTRQTVPSTDRRSPAGQRPEATTEGAGMPARRGQRRGGHAGAHGGHGQHGNHGAHGGAGTRENAGRPQRRPQYSGRGMPNGQRADRSRGA
jgi:ATP-dependent RNA helicase RhlE